MRLLAAADGRVVGPDLQPADVDPVWRETVLGAGLVSHAGDGRLRLTSKGELMLRLLYVYGDPSRE